MKNNVLIHYDPGKTIVVSCDASGYGVGGVLSHRVNGIERPVMFVSGTLSKAEKNYSQLEREALAIIFCVKKFHKYLYGRSFILVSDHAPLKVIFDPNKSMSIMSASRIVRWNVILSAYDYQIEYRKGTQMVEADMLSRLPLEEATGVDNSINAFNLTEVFPITYKDIELETNKDQTLIRVREYVRSGWPGKCPDGLKQYYVKRNELSLEGGGVMLGTKVVIPETLRKFILQMLHEDHNGIVRTKMLARSVLWWPGLQEDLEQLVNTCAICQAVQKENERNLVSWPKAENVFERVHLDFFFKDNKTFLLVVDSKSKWIDIHYMSKGTNAFQTVEKLKITFSIMGLPSIVVTDNGPPFNSDSFQKFCELNGITALKTPPYHPQSNGIAERHVQTVKMALNKYLLERSALPLEYQIVNFLFSFRNTPCASSGLSPNDYIFKIKPTTRLDLLKPGKGSIKRSYDNRFVKVESFSEGDKVWVGKLGLYANEKWRTGCIVKRVSAVTYIVEIDGKHVIKHRNNLRRFLPLKDTIVNQKMTNYDITERFRDSTGNSNLAVDSKLDNGNVEVRNSSTKSHVTDSDQLSLEDNNGNNSPSVTTALPLSEPAMSSNAACDKTPVSDESMDNPLRRSQRNRRPPERLTY